MNQMQASQFAGTLPDDTEKAKLQVSVAKRILSAVTGLFFGACPGEKFYTENRDKAFHFRATNFHSR